MKAVKLPVQAIGDVLQRRWAGDERPVLGGESRLKRGADARAPREHRHLQPPIERSVFEFFDELRDLGFDVDLLVRREPGGIRDREQQAEGERVWRVAVG